LLLALPPSSCGGGPLLLALPALLLALPALLLALPALLLALPPALPMVWV